MPCFTEESEYEAQRQKDEQSELVHSCCRLLTIILFTEDERDLINNIKKEAKNRIYWYRDHLIKDIKYCEEQIRCSLIMDSNSMKNFKERNIPLYPPGISLEEWIIKQQENIKYWNDRINIHNKNLQKVNKQLEK